MESLMIFAKFLLFTPTFGTNEGYWSPTQN